jgi:hypothetical protein
VTAQTLETAWFSPFREATTAHESTEYDVMRSIKEYAYAAFDKLDGNGNGFIEYKELEQALKDPELSDKEKSFITFLVNNRQQIASSFDEGQRSKKLREEGISRQDLQAYFSLAVTMYSCE